MPAAPRTSAVFQDCTVVFQNCTVLVEQRQRERCPLLERATQLANIAGFVLMLVLALHPASTSPLDTLPPAWPPVACLNLYRRDDMAMRIRFWL
jgi:hypothetical protein